MFRLLGTAVFALVCVWASADRPGVSGPRTPADELKTFELADPDLLVELVAAEPDVVSPVAVAWDEDGRMYVVEMNDYPTGPVGGKVKRLEDRDGDGKYEVVSVFADRLPFPTGVLPWKGGVLVTAAPNLWFFKDTDGDGRADERRVVLTGFGEGNPQLRVNGLLWGLDHWVYGANGRSDGTIRRLPAPGEKPMDDLGVSIRRRDFRFRPETGAVEAVAGFSQFGLAMDDWGNRFPSWNTTPMRHVVLEDRYLARNRHLPAADAVAAILDPADPGRLFRRSPAPRTFNRESVEHFNASCGLTVYRGDLLGDPYRGNAFVCEPLTNLVHRRVLVPRGTTFVASSSPSSSPRRAEQGREFLASTDPWFHPVNLATGPDGALYVVDFYREWVEHPQFVAENLRGSVDFRRGWEHGRIWRIRGRQSATPAMARLGRSTAAELVRELEHANGWRRDTAQRLLIERQDRQTVPALRQMAGNARSPQGRVHSLWALHGLQGLDEEALAAALADFDAHVREQAVRLCEGRLRDSPRLRQAVLARADDVETRVRFRSALALVDLGDLGDASDVGDTDVEAALARIAARDLGDEWVRLAVLGSLNGSEERTLRFLRAWLALSKQWQEKPVAESARFIEQLGFVLGRGGAQSEAARWVSLANLPQAMRLADRLAWLVGLAEGLEQTRESLRKRLLEAGELKPLLQAAREAAKHERQEPLERVLAVRCLVLAGGENLGPVLLDLLRPEQPPGVQAAAARGIAELTGQGQPALARQALQQWGRLGMATRRELTAALLRSRASADALLEALEQKTLAGAELAPAAREALLRLPHAQQRARAQQVLKGLQAADRQAVLAKYQAALRMTGDRERGAKLVEKHCQACHQVLGKGHAVGPDLTAVASRPKETLLLDLLDPNKEIAPDYVNFIVVTRRDQVLTGLLAAETPTSVKLRREEGAEETLLRSEIQELRATGKSLMPEGLEQSLGLQDVADLLEFLQRR